MEILQNLHPSTYDVAPLGGDSSGQIQDAATSLNVGEGRNNEIRSRRFPAHRDFKTGNMGAFTWSS